MNSSCGQRASCGIDLESITRHCRSRSARIQPATSRPIMWFELGFRLTSAPGTKSHSSCANEGAAVPRPKAGRWCRLRRIWPAPSRQVTGILAFCRYECPLERAGEVLFDLTALHAPAQKVRPQEFAEWRDVLGEAAGPAQLARETAKRIITQIGDGARNICEFAAAPLRIVWMHPRMVIEHDPEGILRQRTQIRDHADEHVLKAFLMECQSKVMVVDDVVPVSWTHDHRNHMIAQKLADLLGDMRSQMVTLLVHLPHADRH